MRSRPARSEQVTPVSRFSHKSLTINISLGIQELIQASPVDAAREIANFIRQNAIDGIAKIYLFGSVSRNEQTPDSDIDLAVILHSKDYLSIQEEVMARLRDAGVPVGQGSQELDLIFVTRKWLGNPFSELARAIKKGRAL